MKVKWSGGNNGALVLNVSIIDTRKKKVNKLGQVIRKDFAKKTGYKLYLKEKSYDVFHKLK